jgi:hypothetical protein
MSFRYHKAIPILSLFHRPSVEQSSNILRFLRDHPVIKKNQATLEVSENPPTKTQLDTITGYLGGGFAAGKLVDGAHGVSDAVSILEKDKTKLNVPVLVNWEGGKVVLGGDKAQMEHLLEEIRKAA